MEPLLGKASPEAYERLLLDAMAGDATLFARRDEVEEAWRFIDDIEEGWHSDGNASGLFFLSRRELGTGRGRSIDREGRQGLAKTLTGENYGGNPRFSTSDAGRGGTDQPEPEGALGTGGERSDQSFIDQLRGLQRSPGCAQRKHPADGTGDARACLPDHSPGGEPGGFQAKSSGVDQRALPFDRSKFQAGLQRTNCVSFGSKQSGPDTKHFIQPPGFGSPFVFVVARRVFQPDRSTTLELG